ncbi:MAG: acylphosphatase [Hydrogenophilales bacterium CG03_land_8_20_14_0_80_62_28]|nr:acylphosphatase [Betaproteobacteria bacterium]OIO78439.1 MAG: hypothetical protein AUJ86_05375 [Hydrogenophilaceae bacterium CG1_02_62_390]PIV22055.1 MAG: acylphosphatase [Hydrogenophilales bacterium CG03_land_8_20_14_0_80_62_28]PIW37962.1 MAG: acylphosphatase [Hydrogenophilales bacterium CG15_BIG_FIL_POST_REV_8_21_14_020_62_31]PIW72759.1 MAG: acylphosphatase [Hydrogenophilales bacterium CG12_big_fil_rev_8_21_14_0_65_61_21]PIX01106.1 MAG: acylphosphatase [Hydrogenophilales bacterium CG_4_8_
MKLTRHLLISGKVQGVRYRESMCIEAERLGVAGWVRNLASGEVEAVVHGDEALVTEIIRWAWQGPPAAVVANIGVGEEDGEYLYFERRPTV